MSSKHFLKKINHLVFPAHKELFWSFLVFIAARFRNEMKCIQMLNARGLVEGMNHLFTRGENLYANCHSCVTEVSIRMEHIDKCIK